MQSRTALPPISIYRPSGYDRVLAVFYGLIDVIFLGSFAFGVVVGVLGGNPSESLRQPSAVPPLGPIVGTLGWVVLLGLYWVTRRAALDVSASGIRVVPFIGRARTYDWARIAGFAVVGFYPYGGGHYGAGRWYVVVARLNDGGSVVLRATERPSRQADAVARTCEELAAQRPGQGSAAAPSVETLAQLGDARARPGWPGAVQALAGTVADADSAQVPHRFAALHPWLTLTSQLTLFAFLTIAAAGALAEALEFPDGGLAILLEVLLVLLLLGVALMAGIGAMATEQWLRRRQPIAAAFAGQVVPEEPSFVRRLLRRSYGPAAATFGFVWLLVACVGVVDIAERTQAEGARSATVQETGIPTSGVIEQITIVGRTTLVTVRLPSPVEGHAATTVNEPPASGHGAIGETTELLIDPHDPGYSELPGTPYVGTLNWLAVAAEALLWLALALAWARALWQLWRYRQAFVRS
jgi:hypothetical protein